jgi:hypothetical protein
MSSRFGLRCRVALAAACALTMLAGCTSEEPVAPLAGQDAGQPLASRANAPQTSGADTLADFTPRSVVHRNGEITVTGIEISDESPDTYGEEASRPSEVDHAYLSVKVSNQLNHMPLLIQDGIFLDLGSGELIPHTGRNPAINVISAGTTVDGWYAFALPEGARLAAAELVLGEPGYRQERLPLTGEVPESEYPKNIEVASPGTVLTRNACPLEVEVTEAYLAHWVGFDHNGKSYATDQATTDQLKLYLGIAVTAPPGSGGCFIGTASGGDVHLIVDGERRGDFPELNSTTNVAEGTTAHQYLVYDIPASGEVEIEWGRLGGEQVRIPVPVS